MPQLVLPANRPIQISPWQHPGEHTGQLLDVEPETWLVKAPELFDASGELPDYVELAFGHGNFFWRVPAEVKAGYSPWLFLKPPDEDDARRFQRRSFVRISMSMRMVAIPLTPDGKQRGTPQPLDVHNLSAGGCLATASNALGQTGDYMLVAMSLPGQKDIGAPAQLVRVDKGTYGINFHGLKGPARDDLARFVTDQIAHHLQRGRDITLPEPKQGS